MVFKSHACIPELFRANVIFYQSIITYRTITIVIQGANIIKSCIVVVTNYSVIDQKGLLMLENSYCAA